MATIRKTTYRCDVCGQAVERKLDLKQIRVETGSRSYSRYYDQSVGVRADFCDSCEVNLLAALVPFYGEAIELRRDPPKPPRVKKGATP